MNWQERYELSIENAVATYRRNQPMQMFICLVDKKYKSNIWEIAKKKVEREKNQPVLIGDTL